MTDAEAFLPNRVAVSNDALYNLKPISCRGRAYRGSVPPNYKSTFNPSDTMIFYVPGGPTEHIFRWNSKLFKTNY